MASSVTARRLARGVGDRVQEAPAARRAAIAAWLRAERGLALNPKHLAVEPTSAPAVFVGYRISRAGFSASRKLRRRFRRRLRSAAAKGESSLIRSIRSYRGLLLFP